MIGRQQWFFEKFGGDEPGWIVRGAVLESARDGRGGTACDE